MLTTCVKARYRCSASYARPATCATFSIDAAHYQRAARTEETPRAAAIVAASDALETGFASLRWPLPKPAVISAPSQG